MAVKVTVGFRLIGRAKNGKAEDVRTQLHSITRSNCIFFPPLPIVHSRAHWETLVGPQELSDITGEGCFILSDTSRETLKYSMPPSPFPSPTGQGVYCTRIEQ